MLSTLFVIFQKHTTLTPQKNKKAANQYIPDPAAFIYTQCIYYKFYYPSPNTPHKTIKSAIYLHPGCTLCQPLARNFLTKVRVPTHYLGRSPQHRLTVVAHKHKRFRKFIYSCWYNSDWSCCCNYLVGLVLNSNREGTITIDYAFSYLGFLIIQNANLLYTISIRLII